MRRCKQILPAAMLALIPAMAAAQDEPIVFEAESGVRGSEWILSAEDDVEYLSIASTVGGGSPPNDARVITFEVAFPEAGVYELYARLRVGPQTFDDDSLYYAGGFGVQSVGVDEDWILTNNLANPVGYTLPSDKVVGGGPALTEVWKWVKLSAFDGGEPPVAGFTVPEGELTQVFQIAGREDGLDLDKFAFGRQGLFFTVNALDNGLPGSTEPPPPPFTPSGPPIATGKSKFLGSAYSPTQATSFTAYWNKVTPENDAKWGSVEATRDEMNWAGLDTAYELAKSNGFPFHLHVLVWGNQQPAWIETLPPAEQLVEIEEWFAAVAERYPDIDFVEVVNEPLHDPPNQPGSGGGNYIEALGGDGETGWDWIVNAFRMARTYFPGSQLMINDYSITNDDESAQRYKEIVELLQAEDLIDAIGVQGHAFSTPPNIPMSTHVRNLDRLAETGLPIYVTELDIDGPTDEIQLADYQRIFPVFWEHPAVQGITLWGFRPGLWRTAQGAYIVHENGAERPAMLWLQEYVQNDPPEVLPDQEFETSETAADGTAAGTVLGRDDDPDTVLTDWQVDGGDGTAVFAIDSATGALTVVDAAALDFEETTSYSLAVSVYDGYTRSTSQAVTVRILNENDNAPAVNAGQSLRIDGGVRNVVGTLAASDDDDINEPGFTAFQDWSIAGGEGGASFALAGGTGALSVARPLRLDFKKSSYALLVRVGDGVHTSEQQTVTVTIPDHLKMCLWIIDVRVPKRVAPALLRLGASLGACRAR